MVDRIGKGGPKLPPTPTGTPGSTPKVGETGRTFEVQKPAGTAPVTQTTAVGGPSPIEQLRSGQIDVNGYLDLKVNEATGHLQGLTRVELDALRNMLRDQISTDPALADLFQQATGHGPPAPSDD
jgi:hypothetical protein